VALIVVGVLILAGFLIVSALTPIADKHHARLGLLASAFTIVAALLIAFLRAPDLGAPQSISSSPTTPVAPAEPPAAADSAAGARAPSGSADDQAPSPVAKSSNAPDDTASVPRAAPSDTIPVRQWYTPDSGSKLSHIYINETNVGEAVRWVIKGTYPADEQQPATWANFFVRPINGPVPSPPTLFENLALSASPGESFTAVVEFPRALATNPNNRAGVCVGPPGKCWPSGNLLDGRPR
jgi:hypothetical protein